MIEPSPWDDLSPVEKARCVIQYADELAGSPAFKIVPLTVRRLVPVMGLLLLDLAQRVEDLERKVNASDSNRNG